MRMLRKSAKYDIVTRKPRTSFFEGNSWFNFSLRYTKNIKITNHPFFNFTLAPFSSERPNFLHGVSYKKGSLLFIFFFKLNSFLTAFATHITLSKKYMTKAKLIFFFSPLFSFLFKSSPCHSDCDDSVVIFYLTLHSPWFPFLDFLSLPWLMFLHFHVLSSVFCKFVSFPCSIFSCF